MKGINLIFSDTGF